MRIITETPIQFNVVRWPRGRSAVALRTLNCGPRAPKIWGSVGVTNTPASYFNECVRYRKYGFKRVWRRRNPIRPAIIIITRNSSITPRTVYRHIRPPDEPPEWDFSRPAIISRRLYIYIYICVHTRIHAYYFILLLSSEPFELKAASQLFRIIISGIYPRRPTIIVPGSVRVSVSRGFASNVH